MLIIVIYLINILFFKLALNINFKFNGCLKNFDQFWDIYFKVLQRKNFINMQLSLSAKLYCNHMFHVPVIWKNILIFFIIFFYCSFQPWKSSPDVFEFRVRFSWLKYFLVWMKHKIWKLHFDIVNCIQSHWINCNTCVL